MLVYGSAAINISPEYIHLHEEIEGIFRTG